MPKPLGLPVGSVRALVLLALIARAVLDVVHDRRIPPWMAAVLIIAGTAYFAFRSAAPRHVPESGEGTRRVHGPLGLPRGTIRLLVLVGLGVGAWFWFHGRKLDAEGMAVAWILAAFVLGVVVRVVLKLKKRPEDLGTWWIYHVQALVVLMAALGLVALAVTGREGTVPDWVQPFLGAACAYYYGAR